MTPRFPPRPVPLPAPPGDRSGDPRRGAVLLMVLILGLFASALTVVALRAGSAAARSASVYLDEIRAEQLGQSATDLIAARLAGDEAEAKRAGAFQARFLEGVVEVAYVSEAGRIDLNLAEPELIAALFQGLGAEPSVARTVADRVVDWRDEDNEKRPSGAEQEDYRRAGLAGPANRPLSHVSELDQILASIDLDPAVAQAARSLVTVSAGTARIDPGIAPPLLIRALMGGEGGRAESYLASRTAGFARARDATEAFPNAIRKFVGFEPAQAVRATVRVTLKDGFRRSYEAVVKADRADDKVTVESWRSLR